MKRYIHTEVKSTESYISCMSKLGDSDKPAFMVGVYEDGSHVGEPYLKIYNNPRYTKSTMVTRLSLIDGHRIIHKNYDGRQEWDIDNKTLKSLDIFLEKPSNQDTEYSNWQALLYLWNVETSIICGSTPKPYRSMLAAFVAGYYDTEENLSDPNYMPSYAEKPIFAM